LNVISTAPPLTDHSQQLVADLRSLDNQDAHRILAAMIEK